MIFQSLKNAKFVALIALLSVSNIACSKDDKATDLSQVTVETRERAPTPDELARAMQATQEEPQVPVNNNYWTQPQQPNNVGTIQGVDELLNLLPQLGPQAAKIAAFGKAAWKLLEANKPVLNVRANRLSIMPRNVADWTRVQNFKHPRVRAYSVRLKNFYGIEVVKYDYAIAFSYGGNLDGKGQYLKHLTVFNSLVDIAWGFNLDADFAATDALNVGTADNPIPGVQAEVRWKVKTILKAREVTHPFFIAGDGSVVQLNKSRN